MFRRSRYHQVLPIIANEPLHFVAGNGTAIEKSIPILPTYRALGNTQFRMFT